MAQNFDMGAQVRKIMEDITIDVESAMEQVAKESAEQGAELLKSTSPRKTGRYAEGWAVSEKQNVDKNTIYVIHNKTRAMLTHLLNNGHATKNGGRVSGDKHIDKARDEIAKGFTDRAVNAIAKINR